MCVPSTRRWPLLFVVIIVLVVVLALALRSSFRGPQPTHEVHEKTLQLVSRIQGESKIVVATQAMTVALDRAESWYLFNLLYLGETVVKLRVDDCRVQYYITGSEVRLEDFRFDPVAHRLVATLPHPVLDESMIDVPSDPGSWWVYKASGWARFDKDRMEQEARAVLRSRVLEVARRSGWDSQIDMVAKESLRQLARRVFQDVDMSVEIGWR